MKIEPSSYKDTDAFVYTENGEIYRKLSPNYLNTYEQFIKSGLYNELLNNHLIVEHQQISSDTIKPEKVFISYPWEWCFQQIKDAAIATLKIQKIALSYNMTLKDANCFNIQFKYNKPVLIDTSSFEIYVEGKPWVAYRQFCENFLAPLALMSYVDNDMTSLFLSNINGIPLELTSKLLPIKTKLNFGLFMHIHMHAKMQKRCANNYKSIENIKVSKQQQLFLIESLKDAINSIKSPAMNSEWSKYYKNTNYSDAAFEEKIKIIDEYRKFVNPQRVLDLGANTGVFSRIFSKNNAVVFSLDIDKMAVQQNYIQAKKEKDENLIPLVFNLASPSPSVGWCNKERKTMDERLENIDLTLALALIHHLRITYNIPLKQIANYLSKVSKYLIIEFIDKQDSKVQQMLKNRKDIFDDYTEQEFEDIFCKYYRILKKTTPQNTKRIIYLMEVISEE